MFDRHESRPALRAKARHYLVLALGMLAASCSGASSSATTPVGTTPIAVASGSKGRETSAPHSKTRQQAEGVSASLKTIDDFRKKRTLTLGEARRFMLLLVNRDRASMNLPAVTLDEGAAMESGDEHARDMAANGFLGHWGLDGSVPDIRYARHGGHGVVMENASCVTDEQPRGVVENPTIDANGIEDAENMYFNEVPPNDGHRRTILRKEAIRVGIGLAQPVPGRNEIVPPCTSQEFVGPEVTALDVPKEAKFGTDLVIGGESKTSFGGIGITRVDLTPITPAEANKRRSYTYSTPGEMFFPTGYKTRIAVVVKAGKFTLRVPLKGEAYAPGLYEVTTWGESSERGKLATTGLALVRVL